MIGVPCASSAHDVVHDMAAHPLKAHPDVGLDVFHDMPDVERAVGVGQGGGDEEIRGSSELQRAAPYGRSDRRRDGVYEASRNCSKRDLLMAFLKASLPVICR